MVLLKKVSKFLCVDEKEIIQRQNTAQCSYKMFTIPKKDGNERKIFHPSVFVKNIQYALMQLVFSKIKLNSAAYGFIRGLKSPLLKNAKKHANYKYTLCVDIKDFFLSIEPQNLFDSIENNNDWYGLFKVKEMTKQDKDIIKHYCFIKNCGIERLAIGSPSSPDISNIVMREVDNKIMEIAVACGGVYTRYVDDIVVSYDDKGLGNSIYGDIVNIFKTNLSNLKINEKKTRFMSKKKRRVVTGLVIASDSKVSIGREKKRNLKKQIHKYQNGQLNKRTIEFLRGYISYVRDVDKEFINNLYCKYGDEVMDGLIKNKK